jgi:hypothetical protein
MQFQRKGLLTSDNPIGLYSASRRDYEGIGLKTAGAIWFPLDRRSVLLIGPLLPEDGIRIPPTAKRAKLVNATVGSWAYRFIYHHPDDDPTNGIRLPEGEPEFSSIGPELHEVAQHMAQQQWGVPEVRVDQSDPR